MRLTVPNLRGAFLIKAMLALIVVALGDYLFWQRGQWAGAQGLFGLGLTTALIVARPAVIADRRALGVVLERRGVRGRRLRGFRHLVWR